MPYMNKLYMLVSTLRGTYLGPSHDISSHVGLKRR